MLGEFEADASGANIAAEDDPTFKLLTANTPADITNAAAFTHSLNCQTSHTIASTFTHSSLSGKHQHCLPEGQFD